MNKGIFGLKVFRRRQPTCKVVAMISAVAMLCVGSLPAFGRVASGSVLDSVNGNGGATIIQSTGNVDLSGGGSSATLSLLSGKSGLIDWSALNVGRGQTLSFQNGNFYNVVQGGNASQIAGTLKASGSLWIFNPAGVSFFNGAQVDVSGAFSAVAAGLANRDAIFNAIETSGAIPDVALGPVTGNVKVESGAGFTGSDVLLLGNQVSISEGAAFGGDLTVAAARGAAVAVDEVSGGEVCISIADFADVDSDINVTFEATEGSSEVEVGGDLNVLADGSIDVKGAVKADGDITFQTVAKPGSEIVVGHKQMSVASGKLLQGKSVSATAAGKITVDGSIVADEGGVGLSAAELIEVSGNIQAVATVRSANDLSLSGTIEAGTLDATGRNVTITESGSLTADTVTARDLKTAGTVVAETKIAANVEQTGGAISAGDVEGATFKQTDGTAALTGTLTAKVDQDAGALSAHAVVGDIDQDGGTLTVATSVTGDVSQKGTEGDSLTADTIDGDVTQEADNAATISTVRITGTLNQFGGTIKAVGNDLQINGEVIQHDGVLGQDDQSDSIGIGGKLTQNSGAINAETLTLKGGAEQESGATIIAGTLKVEGADKDVSLVSRNNDFDTVEGTVKNMSVVDKDDLKLDALAAAGDLGVDAVGDVSVEGAVTAENVSLTANRGSGDIAVSANVEAGDVVFDGNLVQRGGDVAVADGHDVRVIGTTMQKGGTLGNATGTVTLEKALEQQKGGTINATMLTLKGGAEQEDGATINAGTLKVEGADKDVSLVSRNNDFDTVEGVVKNMSVVDKDDLKLDALAAAGDLGVDAVGDVSVEGAVTAENVSLTANRGSGDIAVSANVEAGDVVFDGNLVQRGGDVAVADGHDVRVTGTTTQEGGTLGNATGTVTLEKALDQKDGGTINAETLTLKGGAEQEDGATINAGTLKVEGADKDVSLVSRNNDFDTVEGTVKNMSVVDKKDDLTLDTLTAAGNLVVNAEKVSVEGAVTATEGGVSITAGSIDVKNIVQTQGSEASANVLLNATDGGVTLEDEVVAAKNVSVIATGDIVQRADVTAQGGTVDVDAAGTLTMDAEVTTEATGNILYVGNGGSVDGTLTATGSGSKAKVVGTAIGGDAVLSADEIVLDVKQLGTADNLVTLNASTLAVKASDGIYVENSKATEIIRASNEDVTVNRVKADLTTEEHGPTGMESVDGLSAAHGDIVLNNAGTITVNADVTAKNVSLTANGGGDIMVNAGNAVSATDGTAALTAANAVTVSGDAQVNAGGDVALTANGKTDVGGEGVAVAVSGTATVEAGKGVSVRSTGEGDVKIDTTGKTADGVNKGIVAKDGSVVIDNADGKVTIENATVAASAKVDVDATDAVEIANKATVTGGTGVEIDTAADVTVDGATVKATTGDVVVGTDADKRIGGSFTAQNGAAVEAAADGGSVGMYASGGVSVVGKSTDGVRTRVAAGTDVVMDASGAVQVDGTVKADGGDVALTAKNDVTVSGEAVVEAAKNVTMKSTEAGDITIDTTNGVTAKDGSVVIDNADGKVTVENATVSGKTGVTIASGGEVALNDGGTVKAGDFEVDEVTGGVTPESPAAADLSITGRSVTVDAGRVAASGELTVTASGAGESDTGVRVLSGSKVAAIGSIKIGSAQEVSVDGSTVAANVGMDVTGAAGVSVNGAQVVSHGDMAVAATSGDVVVTGESKLGTDGKLTVNAEAGSLKVRDTAQLTAVAAADLDGRTDVEIASGAKVFAKAGDVAVDSAEGGISVAGTVTAEAGDVALTAQNAVEVTGENAVVEAGASVSVRSTGEGDIRIDTGKNITAKNGNVTIDNGKGKVTIENATVAASAKVDVDATDAVEIANKATVTGGTGVEIDTAADVTVDGATVEATAGAVALTAGTSVTVAGDAQVNAGGDVALTANGGEVIVKETAKVTADKDATLTASEGVGILGDASIKAGDTAKLVAPEGVSVEGSVGAGRHLDAAGQNVMVAESGSLTVPTVTAAKLTTAGTVVAETRIAANVEQTGGMLNAGDVEGATFRQTGGTAELTGTLKAKVDQDAGALSAHAVIGDIDQDGGTLTVATSVTGDVSQKGASGDSLTAAAISGDVTQEIGNAATLTTASVGGNLEQNGGTVVAQGDVLKIAGTTTQNGGTIGDANDAITLTGKLTQNGGTLNADRLAADGGAEIGGTVDAKTSLTAAGQDVTVAESGSLTAPTVTAAKLTTAGTVKATTVNGMIEQNAGLIEAIDNNLTLNGDVQQNKGTIQASHLILQNGDFVQAGNEARIAVGEVEFDNSKTITLASNNNEIGMISGRLSELDISDKDDLTLGQLTIDGALKVKTGGSTKVNGAVTVGLEADIDASKEIQITGTVKADGGDVALTAKNDVTVSGEAVVEAAKNVTMKSTEAGDITISTTKSVTAKDGSVILDNDKGKVTIENATVAASAKVDIDATADVLVDGSMVAATTGDVVVGNADKRIGGSFTVQNGATVEAADGSVRVYARGNITQSGASITVDRGYADGTQLMAAIKAKSTVLDAGGNIGNGTYDFVTVDGGPVSATGKNVSIASAGDLNVSTINGRDDVSLYTTGKLKTGNGRDDVSLYTTGKLKTGGTVTAGGNMTVTAREFEPAKSHFGSSLTVNNFRDGARPLLAMFETNGGNKTPRIKNQPNSTIVFIDGRLAGGDIQTINKLGALEAFPVQTPELKSEQGVFGNPNFLHDELDVANPFAVGAIDFLLQDVPLLTLTSDFPMEVDKQVAANGLNPTTSYWFGQTAKNESETKEDAEDAKREETSKDVTK